MTFEIFQDKAGEWRWRLKGGNGEIVAQSEGHADKSGAVAGANRIRNGVGPNTPIVTL